MKAMSTEVLSSVVGLSVRGGVGSARRRIEPPDVRWAAGKRAAGWGWQAVAMALRVNREDLRAMVEAGVGVVRPDGEPPPPPKLRPDSHLARALLAIGAGVSTPAALGAALGIKPLYTYQVVARLAELKLVTGNRHLTKAGCDEAERLIAEAAADA